MSFGTTGALAALVGASALLDLALNTELDGWAIFAAVAVTVVALWATGRMRSTVALVVAAAALGPALFLGLRASPWLLTLNLLAVVGLLALGAARAAGGDLFDTRFTTLARQLGSLTISMLIAPGILVQSVAARRSREPADGRNGYSALLRGLALTVPIVVVLGAALASGDAVFASIVRFDTALDNSVNHLLGLLFGLWLVSGFLTQAVRSRPDGSAARRPLVGPLEGSMVLAGLIGVYALFAIARLIVALRGDAYVLETTGMTYAEYARSGFFQLLGAAALTVVVLLVLRSAVDLPTTSNRRVFAVLAGAAVALTLVMVQSATIRLALYDATFGLTMLRLYSTIFAWWVGAVLVLVGVSLCGFRAGRSWLPGLVAVSALVTLLAVNAMDPERVIMARNLDRYHETGRFDLEYALELSPDGLTTLIERRGELPDGMRVQVRRELCPPYADPPDASWNLSVRTYENAREELCLAR